MGLATARAFAEAGAAVVLADINEEAVRAALEYAGRGIRINAVCPGSIKTPMVDDMLAKGWIAMEDMVNGNAIKRLGRPEEIASAVLWLCSPGVSFVIGHALVVDGGAIA